MSDETQLTEAQTAALLAEASRIEPIVGEGGCAVHEGFLFRRLLTAEEAAAVHGELRKGIAKRAAGR